VCELVCDSTHEASQGKNVWLGSVTASVLQQMQLTGADRDPKHEYNRGRQWAMPINAIHEHPADGFELSLFLA
jgi:hypothetical protein